MMLIISAQQLETLDNNQFHTFQEKLYHEIKQRLTLEDLSNISDDELQMRIKYAIDCASDYDINNEEDVIRYAFLVAILGTNFAKNPNNDWIVAILDSAPSANVRLDQLANIIQSL